MTDGSAPAASVIVPTFRDPEGLALCLACLSTQTLAGDRFEILIADNNPEPMPVPPDLPPNARVIHEPAPGSYAARNAAAREARGRVLFFTDSDCRPAPDWIEAGLAALAASPGVERLGGRIEIVPAGAAWTVPEIWDRIFELRQHHYVRKGYAATANLIVTRRLFERVGPFDAGLFSSGDKEWNGRAGRAGAPIAYAGAAIVRHPARTTFADNACKRARIIGGKLATRSKPRWRLWLTLPKYLLPSPKAFARIAREPGLGPGERLGVMAFDYRLRLVDLRIVLAFLFGRHMPERR
ncbi:MAG TPA: glycosyltransferase [Paracoccaceae bacterium]|nr:glycosyltransferase [Paracoccaceae bacterium]